MRTIVVGWPSCARSQPHDLRGFVVQFCGVVMVLVLGVGVACTISIIIMPRCPCEVCLRGRLKRSARAVQLFGRLAVLETHTLRY